jgi:hypothetical protein
VTWNRNEEQEREVEKESDCLQPLQRNLPIEPAKIDTSTQMVAYTIDNVVVAKYPS